MRQCSLGGGTGAGLGAATGRRGRNLCAPSGGGSGCAGCFRGAPSGGGSGCAGCFRSATSGTKHRGKSAWGACLGRRGAAGGGGGHCCRCLVLGTAVWFPSLFCGSGRRSPLFWYTPFFKKGDCHPLFANAFYLKIKKGDQMVFRFTKLFAKCRRGGAGACGRRDRRQAAHWQ